MSDFETCKTGTHKSLDEKDIEIAKLKSVLQPFADAHGKDNPSMFITLHDVRMAYEALNE